MVQKRIIFTALTSVLGTVLSGCAASSDKYPSLAIRDFERSAGSQSDNTSTAIASLNAEQLSQLASARRLAMQEGAAFNSALPKVRAKVSAARGQGPGSNIWAEAQIALADLDSHRSQTAIAMGDIDAVFAEAATDLADLTDHRGLQNEVAAIIVDQDNALAQLRSMM